MLVKLENYVSALPSGLDSYPEFRVKASLFRALVKEHPVTLPAGLPTVLAKLFETPPLDSTWCHGVLYQAATLVVRHLAFESDASFFAETLSKDKKLFSSLMYRALFLVASPEMLLSHSPSRWARFVDGTPLSLESMSNGRAELRVHFPKGAWNLFLLKPPLNSIGMLVEKCGGRKVDVSLALTDGGARFVVTWQ